MSAPARHRLLHASLVLLLLLDLLSLASFAFNQWLDVPFRDAWGLAALLGLPLTMLALPAVDAVLAPAESEAGIPSTGRKIP